ncbi:MAG TPA: UvrD-helicase domain-containing protein [Bryobacteraceae bacterium]
MTPFTADQLDAVDVSKRHLDACVVAGPGSGKTTVLVEYFRRLVEQGVDPLRILAITFTEKAAGNMRTKLAEAFQDDSAVRAKLERAWVSTVHGFCARLLRENAVFAGVDPEFAIADERQAWRMQQEAMSEAMQSLFADRPDGVRALIRGLSSYEFEEAVLSAYDAMRGAGMRLDEVEALPRPAGVTVGQIAATLRFLKQEPLSAWSFKQREHLAEVVEGAETIITAYAAGSREALEAIEGFSCNLQKCKRGTGAYIRAEQLREEIKEAKYTLITEFHAPQRKFLFEILRRFDARYRAAKRDAGLLDFADLEEYTVNLLEQDGETRDRLRAQFDHILMDEFQDTNGQQAKLLKLVRAPDRFYAVGDINQSIFGFRHAEPQGFAEYRDEIERSGRRVVRLVDNFRSRSEILSAVETIAAGARGIEPRALVAGRHFDLPRAVCIEAMIAQPADEIASIEPRWVARRIQELVEERFAYREVAVLVRNTEVLAEFSAAFDDAGIPYLVNRGRGFYDSREVNDLTHLLRTIANPRDEVSLATVLRSPLVEVSDEALVALRAAGDGNIGVVLYRLGAADAENFDPADFLKLTRFRDHLRGWRIRREYVSFDRLLLAALDDCGYRWTPNVDKFLAQARDAAGRMSLDEFVEELKLVRASDPREPDAPPEDSADAVKVMTVHSAKGLEFPVVFVAALHKGIETKPPVVAFSREFGLGARWRNPAKREDKDDLYQHAIREERKVRESDEGERLLYVAMTRAEEHLVLSFTANGKKPQNWALTATEKLGLDPATPCDQVEIRTAPDGKAWNLRIVVADRAPEPLPRTPAAGPGETVELLPMPAVPEQQDTNATVTALASFSRCPRKYFLGHYLGFEGRVLHLEDPEGSGRLSAGEFGTQVHALLSGNPVASPDVDAERLAEVFRQSELGRRSAHAARIEREFDFLMPVEDLVVTGQIDLWFEEGGEMVIVDYKTDAVTAAEARERAQEYGLQLRLYALAIERLTGRAPDRAWLHFLRPNTLVEVDLAPSLLDSPEQIVRDLGDAQSRLEFPLNEGEHCKRCPYYRDLCPAGLSGRDVQYTP